jgi:hypothetical protein
MATKENSSETKITEIEKILVNYYLDDDYDAQGCLDKIYKVLKGEDDGGRKA